MNASGAPNTCKSSAPTLLIKLLAIKLLAVRLNQVLQLIADSSQLLLIGWGSGERVSNTLEPTPDSGIAIRKGD